MSQGAIVNPNRAIPRFRLNNVTPFTYRDGLTYLQIIEKLRDYLNENLDYLVGNGEALKEFAEEAINHLQDLAENSESAAVDVQNIFNELQANGPVVSVNGMHGIVQLPDYDYSLSGSARLDPDTEAITSAIINSAITELSGLGGGVLQLPTGVIDCDETIHIPANVVLSGTVRSGDTSNGTTLMFATDITGVIIEGGFAGIKDVLIRSVDLGVAGTANGIEIRGPRARIDNVTVSEFGGNGLDIRSASANCNLSHVVASRFNRNGVHGIYIVGSDSNLGMFDHVECIGNKAAQMKAGGAKNVFNTMHIDTTRDATDYAVIDEGHSNVYTNLYVEPERPEPGTTVLFSDGSRYGAISTQLYAEPIIEFGSSLPRLTTRVNERNGTRILRLHDVDEGPVNVNGKTYILSSGIGVDGSLTLQQEGGGTIASVLGDLSQTSWATNFVPSGSRNLGAPTQRWETIYGNTVNLSGAVVQGGSGSPNDVVDPGPRGSIYTRTDSAGRTSTLFVSSGTAWIPVDTLAANTSQLNSLTDNINTDKFAGKMVYNSSTKRPVWSTGAQGSSEWVYADGTTAHEPI